MGGREIVRPDRSQAQASLDAPGRTRPLRGGPRSLRGLRHLRPLSAHRSRSRVRERSPGKHRHRDRRLSVSRHLAGLRSRPGRRPEHDREVQLLGSGRPQLLLAAPRSPAARGRRPPRLHKARPARAHASGRLRPRQPDGGALQCVHQGVAQDARHDPVPELRRGAWHRDLRRRRRHRQVPRHPRGVRAAIPGGVRASPTGGAGRPGARLPRGVPASSARNGCRGFPPPRRASRPPA